MRFTISDQSYFYAKYIKSASTKAFCLNLGSKIIYIKSVARCVAIIDIIYKNVTFIRLNLIKIIHQNAQDCINDFKIFSEIMLPNPLASRYFYMKVVIFYSEIHQNINQNASIVACFQKLHRKLSTP